MGERTPLFAHMVHRWDNSVDGSVDADLPVCVDMPTAIFLPVSNNPHSGYHRWYRSAGTPSVFYFFYPLYDTRPGITYSSNVEAPRARGGRPSASPSARLSHGLT